MGFSLTHLTGTGIPDLGDFLFMPQVGAPKPCRAPRRTPDSGYRSRYSHADESAAAGYYRVKLQRSGATVELTAAERAGMLRMTFPVSDDASILTDLQHVLSGGKWKVVWSAHSRGGRVHRHRLPFGERLGQGTAVVFRRALFAALRIAPRSCATARRSNTTPTASAAASRPPALTCSSSRITKTHDAEAITVKVAVSAISATNALKNLDAEIPGWDFEAVREATRAKWDRELAKLQIEGTLEEKETFYTSLYHALLAPIFFRTSRRIPRPRPGGARREGLHQPCRLLALGHLPCDASALHAPRTTARRRHDQLHARAL